MSPGSFAPRETVTLAAFPGAPASPTCVILPGIHGDVSLLGPLVAAFSSRISIAAVAYPRTVEWSLADYAAAVDSALAGEGITSAWLVAESFGSQVAWALVERRRTLGRGFDPLGLVLAGGFVRYMARWRLAATRAVLRKLRSGPAPRFLGAAFCRTYGLWGWLRHRGSPAGRSSAASFLENRRVPGDWPAICHRLDLIAESDFRPTARQFDRPVWALSGFCDPVVPWHSTRRWLRHECPGWRGGTIVPLADHAVLFSAPKPAARRILEWTAGPGSYSP